MAIEVTCGQCHGRLLVETPGGVVACPHCGVHLAIPAPEPDPTVQPDPTTQSEPTTPPEPVLERDTAIETPPAPGSPPTDDDPGDIELNLERAEQLAAESSADAPVDPHNSLSVFGGPDEHDHDAGAGWHSAPNLHLGQGESPSDIGAVGTEPSPALFTSPLMDRTPDPSPDSVRGQAMALFPAFGEPPRSTEPAWDFTPGEAATSVSEATFLSASQQFTLGAPAEELAEAPEQATFLFGASADSAPEAALARTIALPGDGAAEIALSSSQQFSLGAAAATSAAVDAGAAGFGETPSGPVAPALPTVLDAAAARAAEAAASQQKVLTMLLLLVGSYASAVTLALIYLLLAGRTHPLESLPDLKPPPKKGDVTVSDYISPVNDLPSGHVLKLGQSQRFGSLRLTPVKVTRGTVKFKPHSEQSALELFDTEPLLKLWLKFENVSNDQTFSPLDELLVFKRSKQNRGKKVFANNFLAATGNRKQLKSIFRVYDLPTDGDFAMIGQKLNTEVSPGKTWQTFVPSEEDAVELKGDVVWRVHFRKGYHPASLRGVTTLIDVQFNSSDISNDS